MTPGTPTSPRLPNATPSMGGLEAVLSCGPRHRTRPDGSGKPGSVLAECTALSSKVLFPSSTELLTRWLTEPPGGWDVGDSSQQC